MTNILLCGDPQDPIHSLLTRRCEEAGHHVSFYIHPKKQDYTRLDSDAYVEDVMTSLENLEERFDLSFSRKYMPEPFQPEKSYYDVVLPYEMDPYEEVSHTLRDYVLRKAKLGFEGVILIPCYALTLCQAVSLYPEWAARMVGFSLMGLYTGRSAVEVTRTEVTSDAAIKHALAFFTGIGLKPLEVADTPGLVLPRVLAMLVNEAASALTEGVASPEDIDTAMVLGTNYPQGPLAWADQVGVDLVRMTLYHLFSEYGDDRYRPMPLINRMVRLNKLGIKTGEGFYKYPTPPDSALDTASSHQETPLP